MPARGYTPLPGALVDVGCPIDWGHPLNDKLVNWWNAVPNPGWRLGTNLRDAVGAGRNTKNGTLVNGTAWRSGGGAVLFDGANDYIDFGTGNLLVGDFTLAISLNPTSWPAAASGKYPGIFAKRSAFASMSFELYYDTDATHLGLSFGCGNSLAANIQFSANPPTATWSHYVLTRTGSAFTLYRNGASVGTGSSATAVPTGSDKVLAGVLSNDLIGTADYQYDGRIGTIQVFNNGFTAAKAGKLYEQWHRGCPETLNWIGIGSKTISLPDVWAGSAAATTFTKMAGRGGLAGCGGVMVGPGGLAG